MGQVTLESKEITRTDDTLFVITCYQKAMLAAAFEEKTLDSSLIIGEPLQKKGWVNSIKKGVGDTLKQENLGNEYYDLPEIYVDMTVETEQLYEHYLVEWIEIIKVIPFLNWLPSLPIKEIDSKKIVAEKIISPHVLIMHLCTRLFAASLHDGEKDNAKILKYHTFLRVFADELVSSSKSILFANSDKTILDVVGFYLGDAHVVWLDGLENVLKSTTLFQTHLSAFRTAENLLSSINKITHRQLISYLDHGTLERHLSDGYYSKSLRTIEKKMIKKLTHKLEANNKNQLELHVYSTEVGANRKAVINCITNINKDNKEDLYDVTKIKMLYDLLQNTNDIRKITNCVSQFIKASGWVGILTGIIKLDKLQIHLSDYLTDARKKLTCSKNSLLSDESKTALMRTKSISMENLKDKVLTLSQEFITLQNPKFLDWVRSHINKNLKDLNEIQKQYNICIIDIPESGKLPIFDKPQEIIEDDKKIPEQTLVRQIYKDEIIEKSLSEEQIMPEEKHTMMAIEAHVDKKQSVFGKLHDSSKKLISIVHLKDRSKKHMQSQEDKKIVNDKSQELRSMTSFGDSTETSISTEENNTTKISLDPRDKPSTYKTVADGKKELPNKPLKNTTTTSSTHEKQTESFDNESIIKQQDAPHVITDFPSISNELSLIDKDSLWKQAQDIINSQNSDTKCYSELCKILAENPKQVLPDLYYKRLKTAHKLYYIDTLVDADNNSLLHCAVTNQQEDLIDWLLFYGASVLEENKVGMTALLIGSKLQGEIGNKIYLKLVDQAKIEARPHRDNIAPFNVLVECSDDFSGALFVGLKEYNELVIKRNNGTFYSVWKWFLEVTKQDQTSQRNESQAIAYMALKLAESSRNYPHLLATLEQFSKLADIAGSELHKKFAEVVQIGKQILDNNLKKDLCTKQLQEFTAQKEAIVQRKVADANKDKDFAALKVNNNTLTEHYNTLNKKHNTLNENYNTLNENYNTLNENHNKTQLELKESKTEIEQSKTKIGQLEENDIKKDAEFKEFKENADTEIKESKKEIKELKDVATKIKQEFDKQLRDQQIETQRQYAELKAMIFNQQAHRTSSSENLVIENKNSLGSSNKLQPTTGSLTTGSQTFFNKTPSQLPKSLPEQQSKTPIPPKKLVIEVKNNSKLDVSTSTTESQTQSNRPLTQRPLPPTKPVSSNLINTGL